MDEEDEVNFCELVAAEVKRQYGYDGTADLCFNLLESGVIDQDATVNQAARIVAQHMEQQ